MYHFDISCDISFSLFGKFMHLENIAHLMYQALVTGKIPNIIL